MSKHWTPDRLVRPDIRLRRRRNNALEVGPSKLLLLCAAALFGAAIAIGESLLP